MGKKIKLREAQKRAADAAIAARLRAHTPARPSAAFITTYSDFAPHERAKIEAYRGLALREPEFWRCHLRCRSPEKRFLDLVTFTFARYPVPRHLQNAWTEDAHIFAGGLPAPVDAQAEPAGMTDLRRWYIIAAQGGSLYREATRHYLTKAETHHFLNAPDEVTSTTRAFWYAIARAQTDDAEVALRISRTKISAFPLWETWKDAARFFARNPTTVLEMNDLIDFFQVCNDYEMPMVLAGRTLPAVRRRMVAWHRTLAERDLVCGRRWAGRDQPNIAYVENGEHGRAVWRFRQIKDGDALLREGQRMHHCVVTYKSNCVNGLISIWSLTCEFPAGRVNRGLTIEVQSGGAIVQCRGFANRAPCATEDTMVKRWAAEHGLTWQGEQ